MRTADPTTWEPQPPTLELLAAGAREGCAAARNELWSVVQPVVEAALPAQRSLPRLWDRDDLAQEAFVVFAELCSGWTGKEFATYFEQEFPRQLALRVRRERRRQSRDLPLILAAELSHDPETVRLYRLAELLEVLNRLPAPLHLALRLHLLWEMPLAEVGRQLGLSRRTVGGIIPLARQLASEPLQDPYTRVERLIRGLYRYTDLTCRIRADARQVRAGLRLTPKEYHELIATLEEAGVLQGRSRGHAGRLSAAGPNAALKLLRQRYDRSA